MPSLFGAGCQIFARRRDICRIAKVTESREGEVSASILLEALHGEQPLARLASRARRFAPPASARKGGMGNGRSSGFVQLEDSFRARALLVVRAVGM